MKIILDFDDTIFNTYDLMQEILQVFKKVGFTDKEFWDVYKRHRNKGGINKELMINSLFELKIFDKNKIETEINSILNQSKKFIYTDLFDFTRNFNKSDLILLSFGNPIFQKGKIKNSKIDLFFDEVIVTLKEKAENLKLICEKYNKEEIFFIDDKAEQIDKVKEKLPKIIAIKMERSNLKHMDTKSKFADYVVKDLNEAKNIISNLNK